MKESVLDVLMYLFEHYADEDTETPEPDWDQLELKLRDAGFPSGDIDRAFRWLDGLAQQSESPAAPAAENALRLYDAAEMNRLDTELRGFLLLLEQGGVLDPGARELVIDRVMALDEESIDMEQLKWVVLMVLSNRPKQALGIRELEDWVFEEAPPYLH